MGSADVGEGSLSSHGLEEDATSKPRPATRTAPSRSWSTSRFGGSDHHRSRSRDLGRAGQRQREMSDDREIVCNRFVFVDSEFDAKKGQGEPPGPPVCICAIEIDQHGRETEHRLAAPYPAKPPWERDGDPYLTVGFALSAEAGSFMHVAWPFPLPAIDLYAEYMVLHNTEMVRKARGQQTAGAEPDQGVPALRRGRDGSGPQGGHAVAGLYQDRSHPGRNRPAAGLLHRRLPDDGAAVQGDAAAHRFPARTDPRRVHDGDRAHALARHSDRHADLSPDRAAARPMSRRACARS